MKEGNEDTAQATKLSKLVWQRIKGDLSIPMLYHPKDANIAQLQTKVDKLLESIPFEEDDMLESVDREFVVRWAKDLKLPVLEEAGTAKAGLGHESASFSGDTRAEDISMLSREELSLWSDEAYELAVLLAKLCYLPQLCNELYIRHFFKTFKFDSSKVGVIDEEFRSFSSLRTLSISHNRIAVLQNLPPQLVELNAYNNVIADVKGSVVASLRHLGIAYNKLTTQSIRNARQCTDCGSPNRAVFPRPRVS